MLIVGLFLSLAQSASGATVRINAPLQEHYRPGRYVPLHVIASDVRGGSLKISADHLLPVRIDAPGGSIDTEVPLLPLGTLPEQLDIADESTLPPIPISWHALGDYDRLVGLVGIDSLNAPHLFDQVRVQFVPLEIGATGGGGRLAQISAWETLDALVLDAPAAARMDETQLSVLLASGTVLAVRSEARPAGAWPWVRDGAFWVLRFDPIGPRNLSDAGVYQPTYGWKRGWSTGVRARAVAAAIVFCVLAGLLTLKRFKGSGIVFVMGCAVFSIIWIGIDKGRSRTIQLTGDIEINDGSLTQRDAWTWEASLGSTPSQWVARGCAHPFLVSQIQMQSLDLQMRWDPSAERLQFDYSLSPGRSIALLTRSVNPATSPIAVAVPGSLRLQNSLMLDLFNKQYAGANTAVLGERDDDTSGSAGAVILVARRSKP